MYERKKNTEKCVQLIGLINLTSTLKKILFFFFWKRFFHFFYWKNGLDKRWLNFQCPNESRNCQFFFYFYMFMLNCVNRKIKKKSSFISSPITKQFFEWTISWKISIPLNIWFSFFMFCFCSLIPFSTI